MPSAAHLCIGQVHAGELLPQRRLVAAAAEVKVLHDDAGAARRIGRQGAIVEHLGDPQRVRVCVPHGQSRSKVSPARRLQSLLTAAQLLQLVVQGELQEGRHAPYMARKPSASPLNMLSSRPFACNATVASAGHVHAARAKHTIRKAQAPRISTSTSTRVAPTCFTKKDMPLSVSYREDDAQPDDPRPLMLVTLPASGTSASIHSAIASFALNGACYAAMRSAATRAIHVQESGCWSLQRSSGFAHAEGIAM